MAKQKSLNSQIDRYYQILDEFKHQYALHEGAVSVAFQNLLADTARAFIGPSSPSSPTKTPANPSAPTAHSKTRWASSADTGDLRLILNEILINENLRLIKIHPHRQHRTFPDFANLIN
jgi:hypothetical protein